MKIPLARSRMPLKTLPILAATVVALSSAAAGGAETAANGFVVRYELIIEAPVAMVYDSLIGHVGSWWNEQHTYSGDSKNLSIDPRPGGCFCERLTDGGVEHMRVVYLRQNQMLRMVGGLGPLQGSGVSGSMTWQLNPVGNGTRLLLTYSVGGFMAGGFESIAPAVQRVLGEQADRLKRFAETGTPVSAR
jgi:uncharacterized protein YndB with AHSA1/START domain